MRAQVLSNLVLYSPSLRLIKAVSAPDIMFTFQSAGRKLEQERAPPPL